MVCLVYLWHLYIHIVNVVHNSIHIHYVHINIRSLYLQTNCFSISWQRWRHGPHATLPISGHCLQARKMVTTNTHTCIHTKDEQSRGSYWASLEGGVWHTPSLSLSFLTHSFLSPHTCKVTRTRAHTHTHTHTHISWLILSMAT
jgi:hypothetical protein